MFIKLLILLALGLTIISMLNKPIDQDSKKIIIALLVLLILIVCVLNYNGAEHFTSKS